MFKHCHRSRANSVKKKTLDKSVLQDMNFLSLKEFYNSIPDYSDINHLPEKEFYHELDQLKKKQQLLTEPKKSHKPKAKKSSSDKNSSRSSHHFDSFSIGNNAYETKRNITEHISFADDGNSISSWQLEYGSITCRKRDNQSRLSSATSRPRTSRAESRSIKQQSRVSNVQDDYELLNSLKNYRSKSISPTRSQLHDCKYQKETAEDCKFYSDITQDKLKSVDHTVKRDPIKDIPMTSRIPLLKQVQEDQKHKSELARLDSAIKLTSKVKPFKFHESRSSSRRCLSRSFSTPQLKNNSDSDEPEENLEHPDQPCNFRAKPFPKNLFCNYFHYKMWEDNYFRALNKKLRAEELLKLSKLPPSMAKRENEKKKNDALEELDIVHAATASSADKQNVVFSPISRKKKLRRKLRKSKSAIGTSRGQFAKSYIFDTKRDRDRGSVKSETTTTTTTNGKNNRESPDDKISPIYPVNRPNLAATLRYEWSRDKLKKLRDAKELIMRDKYKKTSWGVKNSHAFQQMTMETSNDDEIAIRLATRRAEQKLRQEEHEINMALMKHRVKTAPLLLEGPTHLAPRLGHIYHHCDVADDKKKIDNYLQQNNLLKPPSSHHHHHHNHHHKAQRSESTLSSDSKITESTSNTKLT